MKTEYQLDRGFKSRKFLLVLTSVVLAVLLGVIYPLLGWGIAYLDATLGTLATLVLGYCGISAGRDAIPRAVSSLAKNKKETTQTAVDRDAQVGISPLEDEASP